ncbi:MAG: ABC transporter substrate-binding protein [Pirellulaceae bacterium]
MIRSNSPIWLLLLLMLVGCSKSSDSTTNTTSVQLNWKAESEHGGLYQAQVDGLYKNAGLNVAIRPGGINAPIGPELELGRCQFAMANADDVVLLRNEGVDIVAVLAAMQNHPRCIMARADSSVNSLQDLAGTTFQHGPRPYVEFMRSKGLLENVKEVPYQGSVAPLVADPKIIIQGYSFSEPLLAAQQGVKVRTMMVSELGFNPYSSVLVTTGKLIRNDPKLVQDFVTATRQGWRNYLTDPTKGNAAILIANKQMTAETLERGMGELRKLARPNDLAIDVVGQMTTERWTTLVDQLIELNLVDAKNVKANDCFTLEFL